MQEKIETILKHPWTIPAVIGVLSFGGGLGVGYILGKRKQEQEYVESVHQLPEQLDLNFEEKDEPTTELNRPPKVVITPEVAVSKDILKVNDLSELRPSMLETEDDEDDEEEIDYEAVTGPGIERFLTDDSETVVTIAPVTDEIEWDYEEELKSRSSSAPYILHQEEFYADELNYSQSTLTYYEGDDIMTDEDEKPVYNYSNVTGPLRFGHGSGDPNIVYIRNDKNRAVYEVIQLEGALYSVEILGLEIENNERVADLKHSKLLKFRTD